MASPVSTAPSASVDAVAVAVAPPTAADEEISPSKRPSRAAGRLASERAVKAAQTWQPPKEEEEPPRPVVPSAVELESAPAPPEPTFIAPPERRETRELSDAYDKPLLTGDYANKFIRQGEDYQAVVPSFTDPEGSAERGDELFQVEYTPLTAAPVMPEIPDLKAIAAKAAAEKARLAAAPKKVTEITEDIDLDEDGLPLLPDGIERGGFCTAWGTNAGERRQYKAILVSVRPVFPPFLVKYVGDLQGGTNALLLPEVRNSFVNLPDISPWVPPEERQPAGGGSGESGTEADASEGGGGGGGGDGGDRSSSSSRRGGRSLPARSTRYVKPALQLLTEAGGLTLHLDPRRDAEDYMGTGYRGVHDDYWHSGYKKERPYVVCFEGAYQGRYATVEQAAVCYARLEMGMPPLPQQQPATGGGGGGSSTDGGATVEDGAAPAANSGAKPNEQEPASKRQKTAGRRAGLRGSAA
jgi:hypothetical protein